MSQTKKKVERVYDYIKTCLNTKRLSPTQREIAKDCQLSVATVSDYLSVLEAQGRIARTPYISRSIRLTDGTPQTDDKIEEVYDYIQESIEAGQAPTQAEIAQDCYLSRADVRRALVWLEAQHRIKRGKGQRSIQILD